MMAGETSRRRFLRGAALGAVGGLAGCSALEARLARGKVQNTVEKTYEPDDMSTSFSLETGQAVSFGNGDLVVLNSDDEKEVARPHASALFHAETGAEIPVQSDAPSGDGSVSYADGIGAPKDGEYVCAVAPSLQVPEQGVGFEHGPDLDRTLEVYGKAETYEPITETPYPLGRAVEVLETSVENVGSEEDRLVYPVPIQYFDVRFDRSYSLNIPDSADTSFIDGEATGIRGDRVLEAAQVELAKARSVESLSASDREDYVSRLTDIRRTLYAEYGVEEQRAELRDMEHDVADAIASVVISELGTDVSRLNDAIRDEIGYAIDFGNEALQELEVPSDAEDPTVGAEWALTGRKEIDLEGEEDDLTSVDRYLPDYVSPVFAVSVSITFSGTTDITTNGGFPTSADASVSSPPREPDVTVIPDP